MNTQMDGPPQLSPELSLSQLSGRPEASAAGPPGTTLLQAAMDSERALSRLADALPELNGMVYEFIRVMRGRIKPILSSGQPGQPGGAAPPPTSPGVMNAPF